jgi:hypothetical protein
VKIGEWFKKLLRRSPQDGEDEKSSDAVEEAFTTSFGEASSSYVPSQQDRPQH